VSFSCWRGAVLALAWAALGAPATAGVGYIFSDGLETGGSERWTCTATDSGTTCPVCTVQGGSCIDDLDCCNSYCDRPGGIPVGQCAEIGLCAVSGEPCAPPGTNGSCCSLACVPAADGGARCERIGGCKPADEVCTGGAQCCSGSCVANGMTSDGRPILRCASGVGCLAAGETCTPGSANCCPAGGGDVGCELPFSGVDRCFGGTPGCVLPGDACADTLECCAETFANVQCQAGPGGNNVCCLGSGESCAFGDVCCSGLCAPNGAGNLVCAAGCVATGAACTTGADCCDGCCRRDGAGGLACTTSCGSGSCALGQLGEACDLGAPCCPDLTCGGDPNFQTCQLQ
jgi:hypothetical protein